MFYHACTVCKKKVSEDHAGFRCESCQRTYPESNLSYNFSVQVGDFSDSVYLQCMGEVGDTLIGMTAKDFHAISLENPEAVKKILVRRMFQEYTLLVRATLS